MTLNLADVLDRFRRIRARTRAMFDLLDEAAYYERPIALRNPIVFYEGHLPAFAVNALVKKGLGWPGIDDHLERIFARGIDPESEALAIARGNPAWPARATVIEYAAAADEAIERAIEAVAERMGSARTDAGNPLLRNAEAVWAILEHEEMHHETMAYMWHQLAYSMKTKPDTYVTSPPRLSSSRPMPDQADIPGGAVTLGTGPEAAFAWDNERPPCVVSVDAFSIDVYNVTNADFMAFVDAGGYRDARWWRPADWQWLNAAAVTHPAFWQHDGGRWYWRGMFERVPLPEAWPVYVTWAEANAYARWRGMRLPTEGEFHRAACGVSIGRANLDFARWDPEPVGAHRDSISRFGVHDLIGNGWEWTSTVFAPFPGFTPLPSYPEYSADFFDGEHFVLKGASPVTARSLTRPGFRNWFRPQYPYVYASFRCVRGGKP